MINQEKKSSGPIVVGGAVYMGKADQAKPTPEGAISYEDMVFCSNYMLALAKLFNLKDVREVPGKLQRYGKNASRQCLNGEYHPDFIGGMEFNKISTALAAGEHDD